MHSIATETTVPSRGGNDPVIRLQIRRLHRIGSGRYGYAPDGGTLMSKIADDHQLLAYFIGEELEFSFRGRRKPAFRRLE